MTLEGMVLCYNLVLSSNLTVQTVNVELKKWSVREVSVRDKERRNKTVKMEICLWTELCKRFIGFCCWLLKIQTKMEMSRYIWDKTTSCPYLIIEAKTTKKVWLIIINIILQIRKDLLSWTQREWGWSQIGIMLDIVIKKAPKWCEFWKWS